ncbi:MAG: sodium:proton antiporter [Cyclobacteriaceae bacterium]|jgi:CPA1 family monovalent cation:H+ antiporter|nr:sodium:proton antiporter [Cyclobacteriaceae bacterium]MDB4603005.1 sodium:proton antiporter [Cyclobacteriaceae bacterium]
MSIIDLITLLLVLSAAFTLINIAYFKLPSTIGLMLIALISSALVLLVGILFPGIAQGAEHIIEEFEFKEVLLDIMLNFLLFAGALSMDLNTMIEEKVPIIILAVFGTLISTFVVGALVFYIFPLMGIEMDFIYCLLFGALISPTDPIAVLALLKKFNLSKNLEIKVAGESLFNDGVGVVVFLTILGVAERGMDTFNIGEVGILFGQEVFGGLLLGAILGYLGFKTLLFIDNDYVELEVLVTLSLVMIGGRFAESIHVSAPLAMVILGLFIGNKGRDEKLANATGKYVFKFWHLLDETLNAMLFILIGLEMLVIAKDVTSDMFLLGAVGILIVLTGRSIGVSLPVGLMSLKIKFEKGATPLLIWGGLRGGISVALALSLSDFEWIPSDFKIIILFTTYCVVVFSILVQGLTIPALLRKIQ